MNGFAGKVAVVTGAGSGIGRALAIELARAGAILAISDVDTGALADTEIQLKSIGALVKADYLDVSDNEAFIAYAAAVNDHFGKVNQIYSNAGVAFFGDVEITHIAEIERVMNINYWGVVYGTKAFLPYLIASGDGHVVNVSSAFGLFAVPGQAAYNSSKFAVRGFSEALCQEMAVARHPVKVSTVFPGGITSAFVKNMTFAAELGDFGVPKSFEVRLWSTSPQKAAQIILNGVRKNRARILVGPDIRLLDLLVRISGSAYQRLVPPVARRFTAPLR
jgi:NAD(P)-dependent dehydrogenase (short-subunit alcohol dehydrogenase family)